MLKQSLGHVLVVDDEISVTSSICEMLTQQGYDTFGCTSCRRAFDYLSNQEIDLLLTDLVMPEMGGIEFLKSALGIEPNLIGIIMTEQATVETAVQAMKVGAFDYLIKPIKLEALLPVLSKALEVRRLRRENITLRGTVAIYELSKLASLTLDPKAILEKIADAAIEQCNADEASIMIPTDDGNELQVVVVRGESRHNIFGISVPIEKGIAGWVARTKESLLLQGKVEDPRFSPVKPRPDIKSSISLPMMVGGKLTGIINIATTRQHTLSMGQLKALSILTSIASHALENSLLYTRLKDREERLSIITDNLMDVIWTLDMDERFTFITPSVKKITGYTEDEMVGRKLEQILTPEGYKKAKETIAYHLKRKVPNIANLELEQLCKDGSTKWCEVTATFIRNAQGVPIGMIGTTRDITEKKKLQEQFFQAQKMEAVGRLAGGIAHDFNNILTAISGFATFIKQGLPPEHPNREDIEEIISASKSAMSLTMQLLAFSRRQAIVPQRLHLNELIFNTNKMLIRLIGENIELVYLLASDLWTIEADPGMLNQLIINLAVNAYDAMPNGGKFIIETANITVDEDFVHAHVDMEPGEYVMLAVSDTGCGMSDEVKSHLFEPFFTTKEQGKGTGLGLSTVYGVVKQHRGSIHVYSKPGLGTTIKIYFPRIKGEGGQILRQEAASHLPKGTETVLVVEDAQAVRNMEVKTLQSLGYKILEAANGEEALKVSDDYEGEIHILLSDVVMPFLGGSKLFKKLREKRPLLKILFVSGYTDDHILRCTLIEENLPFLQKPFTTEGLAFKIREVLDGKKTA